jgi:hypothetical protein
MIGQIEEGYEGGIIIPKGKFNELGGINVDKCTRDN